MPSYPHPQDLQAVFNETLKHFGPFEPTPHLAVAVSGGADSLALCLLAQSFAADCGGSVTAVSVDHNLRPDERKALENLSALLEQKAIPHFILNLAIPLSCHKSRIEEAARIARYAALEKFCYERGICHLLTGHQQNDQEETRLMRLERKATPFALGGIDREVPKFFGRLLRPLLNIRKETLQTFLRGKNISWFEDSMNKDTAFERARLRNMKKVSQDDCPKPLLGSSETFLDEVRQNNRKAFQKALQKGDVRFYRWGGAALRLKTSHTDPSSPHFWIFQHTMHIIGAQPYPPSPLKLQNCLKSFLDKPAAFTLGGCLLALHKKTQELCLYREIRRRRFAPLKQFLEAPLRLFDRRFYIHTMPRFQNTATLTLGFFPKDAISSKTHPALKAALEPIPFEARGGLPCLYEPSGKLIDVPLWVKTDATPLYLSFYPLHTLGGSLFFPPLGENQGSFKGENSLHSFHKGL